MMKGRFIVLLAGILVLGSAMAQTQLSWRFSNAAVINAGTQFQFDVEVKADAAGTYHRDLQVYFDYSTSAFGNDIGTSAAVTVTPLTLMETHYSIVNDVDNTSSKYAIITEADNEMTQVGSATHFNEMPTAYTGLLRVTIDVLDNEAIAGIAFDEELMNGGQYYQSLATTDPVKYVDPCLYDNDLATLKMSSIYGTITYNNTASTPLPSCTVTLKQGTTTIGTATTDENGVYGFTGIADGDYTLETDCSLPRGGTGLIDYVRIRQFLLGQFTFTTLQQMSADVDAGGSVGLIDYVRIRQFLLGQISSWNQSDWVFEVHSVTVTNGLGTLNYQGLCSGDPDGSYVP